jgi:peptidoglycan hydrolase CwlO-like protein
MTKPILVEKLTTIGARTQGMRDSILTPVQADEQEPVANLTQLQERANLLESEIDANEEENRTMQRKLDGLYVKIDALKA